MAIHYECQCKVSNFCLQYDVFSLTIIFSLFLVHYFSIWLIQIQQHIIIVSVKVEVHFLFNILLSHLVVLVATVTNFVFVFDGFQHLIAECQILDSSSDN